MEMKIPAIAITAVVVIVVLAGVLMPVLDDARDNIGPEITKTNVGTGHTFKEMVPGDVLMCTSDYTVSPRTDTWTLNGETVLNEGITGLTWDWGLISDAYYLMVNANDNASIGSGSVISSTPGTPIYYGKGTAVDNATFSWTMNSDKTITYVKTTDGVAGTPTVYSSTWAYVVSSIEDGAYMSAQVTTNPYFAKYNDKDIILAGNYTTGDLDTGYYYGKDGVLTVVNSSYTGTVNFEQELSAGTTDVYDTLVTVSITDGTNTEEFSPYRALVLYQVTGHESSGASYDLLGVIPVMVVIALLVAVVALVFRSRQF